MNKIDLIISWPRNCDYPLWRQQIRDNRDKFNKIFIVFTEAPGRAYDFRDFIEIAMFEDKIDFIQSPVIQGEDDWRNVAIREALQFSKSEWVFFTEQDFIINGPEFWQQVEQFIAGKYEVFGLFDAERLHPCCIFMKRELLNKTHKNFAIVKDKSDHFKLLQNELETIKIPLGKLTTGCKHLAGLTSNLTLVMEG